MARPRLSGEGSIYRRHDHATCPPPGPDGQRPEHRCRGRWTATIELPPVAGRRRRATFFGASHAEVKEKLNEARKRLQAGAPAKDARSRLSEVVEEWITTSLAASDRKPATKTTYAILLRTHVLTDDLASMPIGRIKTSDIESLIVRLRAKRLSPSTVRQIYTVLRQVFDTAVRDELLRGNPAAKLRRPTVTSRESRALLPREVAALLTAAERSSYEPLLRVLVTTGLRRGEALALRWADVDLNNGLLTIRGTLARTSEGLRVVPPKTERSKRTIPISRSTVATLRAVRAAQDKTRAKAGRAWEDSDLVFTTELGAPLDPRNALRAATTAARKAGLAGVGLHTLRHTAASTMLEAGVPLRTVSEILGHASIQVTGDIYGHVSTEGARSAIDRLADALEWTEG